MGSKVFAISYKIQSKALDFYCLRTELVLYLQRFCQSLQCSKSVGGPPINKKKSKKKEEQEEHVQFHDLGNR